MLNNEADARWLLVIACEASGLKWPGGDVPQPAVRTKAKRPKRGAKSPDPL